MSSRSSSSTPQIRFSVWKSRRASSSRLATSACIAGSSRSRARKLQRQAFGKVAGEEAGRLEGLADRQHLGHRRAASVPRRAAISSRSAAQIAGLVEPIGQFARDQPRRRIGEGEGDLLADMIAQRDRGRRHVARRRSLSDEAAAAVAGRRLPLRRQVGPEPLAGARIVGKDVFQRRVELLRDRLGAPCGVALEPVAVGGRSRLGLGLLRLVARGVVLRLGALQQRVALDLLVDEALELEMGELQQPDRLHQLRRHHQRLRLSQL